MFIHNISQFLTAPIAGTAFFLLYIGRLLSISWARDPDLVRYCYQSRRLQQLATAALLYAAHGYILVCAERDRLQTELEKLEYKHHDLIDDIETGLDAQARVLKAIGRK